MSFKNFGDEDEIKAIGNIYKDSSLVLVPFEYKQSALFHSWTYEVIDSVVDILLKNKAITLSVAGYAHKDEGNDTILKYLSLNRALFVRDYILARGVDSERIFSLKALGKSRPLFKSTDKRGIALNCRVELKLNYPIPPEILRKMDRDADGIADFEDNCPDAFGYAENGGCPDKDMVMVPFEMRESSLSSFTFNVLDSVVTVLKNNPSYRVGIEGHAFKAEGIQVVCNQLAYQRSENVKNYFLSRYIAASRILSVKSYGSNRPLNSGNTPKEMYQNARSQIFFKK
jgi:outer membrane protein OmpA-like peptidoglycan-associated protein